MVEALKVNGCRGSLRGRDSILFFKSFEEIIPLSLIWLSMRRFGCDVLMQRAKQALLFGGHQDTHDYKTLPLCTCALSDFRIASPLALASPSSLHY